MDNILKEIRANLGYTQDKMAEKLDIHKQTYIRYENGSRKIPSQVLKKISEISGESLNYLFGYQSISGDHNTQISGSNISIGSTSDSKELVEVIELLRKYGNTKLISDLKEKLLKIKELS
ncbi:helix-turn-helix transcriptional regulator [Campylobacter sp. 7477a]|uniref:helix-turn-helix transcriptional regulator n=1 Tax=Campylobacter sp. 7477a TaxID=2735741 RepID=UPI00301436BD|nr:helix-turn-helix transcriptional regulator [Campylobacter sp. 7477a]